MQINIQNNQENSYEKFKKFLNNPITKFSLGTVGGLTGIGVLSLIAKLIYDKIHQNKIDKVYNELVIDNDVALSVADQIWIAKNMILFAQEYPLCWHNVFMQLLACPEYISYSNDPNHPIHKSKKIMTMIDFAKKNLPGIFSEGKVKIPKVTVPMEVRQMPNDVFSEDDSGNLKVVNDEPNKGWLKDNKKHSFILRPSQIYYEDYRFDDIQFNELGILDTPVTKFYNTGEKEYGKDCDIWKPINELDSSQLKTIKSEKVYGWYSWYKKDDVMKYYNKKSENILNCCDKAYENYFPFKDINCCQEYGYYPTFVVIFDDVDYSSVPHYHCCYIVYDKNKNIKYFLWGDGIKKSFRVMSADKSLEKLNKYSTIWVKYSRNDIVEKFYTPESIVEKR